MHYARHTSQTLSQSAPRRRAGRSLHDFPRAQLTPPRAPAESVRRAGASHDGKNAGPPDVKCGPGLADFCRYRAGFTDAFGVRRTGFFSVTISGPGVTIRPRRFPNRRRCCSSAPAAPESPRASVAAAATVKAKVARSEISSDFKLSFFRVTPIHTTLSRK